MTGQADLSLLSCWQQGSDRFISSSVVTCPPHSEQQASMAFVIVAAPRLLPGLKARGYDSSKPRTPAPRLVCAASGKVSYPLSQHEDLSVRSLPFVLSVLGPIISASVISTQQDDSPMTEGNMADMMAKLAAAEAEAEKLRSELKESAKAPVPTGTIDELAKQKPAKPENRIDGKGGRETLFGTAKNSGDAWLKDGMQFLARDQPSELGESVEMSKEDQDTVNRRLAIGLLGTGIFVGLSQISVEAPAPSKPLFFYLVPLVKTRELLKQAADLAENGYWWVFVSLPFSNFFSTDSSMGLALTTGMSYPRCAARLSWRTVPRRTCSRLQRTSTRGRKRRRSRWPSTSLS